MTSSASSSKYRLQIMYGFPSTLKGSGVMYSSMHACRAGIISVETVIFFSMRLNVLPATSLPPFAPDVARGISVYSAPGRTRTLYILFVKNV